MENNKFTLGSVVRVTVEMADSTIIMDMTRSTATLEVKTEITEIDRGRGYIRQDARNVGFLLNVTAEDVRFWHEERFNILERTDVQEEEQAIEDSGRIIRFRKGQDNEKSDNGSDSGDDIFDSSE